MEPKADNGDFRYKFDAYCKAVLRNAARNYLNDLKRRREKEKSLDLLSVSEQRQLTTTDLYPSDSISFSAYGYELLIDSEKLARAFSSLTRRKQTVLILRFAAGFNDRETGELIGLARSTVQYHRSTALRAMKRQLTISPEEGGRRDNSEIWAAPSDRDRGSPSRETGRHIPRSPAL